MSLNAQFEYPYNIIATTEAEKSLKFSAHGNFNGKMTKKQKIGVSHPKDSFL